MLTGVAGFIGSHVADALINEGHEVIGIDNLSNGLKSNINKEVQFHQIDIRDPQIEDLFSGIDVVFHQAALGSVPRSFQNPNETNDVNINGFANILKLSEKYNVKKLIFASSSSVYGDTNVLPRREESIGKQTSPYASSKRVGELLAEPSFIPTIGLRYFNVYGPRQRADLDFSAVVPRWIKAVKNRESISLDGDGTSVRDYTYISDVVSANIKALHLPTSGMSRHRGGGLYEIFNVGTGRWTLLNDLLVKIIHGLNVPKSELNIVRSVNPPRLPLASFANLDRSNKFLGYYPIVDLDTGLALTINQ